MGFGHFVALPFPALRSSLAFVPDIPLDKARFETDKNYI
jgi:hypothetical protein